MTQPDIAAPESASKTDAYEAAWDGHGDDCDYHFQVRVWHAGFGPVVLEMRGNRQAYLGPEESRTIAQALLHAAEDAETQTRTRVVFAVESHDEATS